MKPEAIMKLRYGRQHKERQETIKTWEPPARSRTEADIKKQDLVSLLIQARR